MKINNLRKLISVFFSDIKEFSFGVAVGRLRKDFPLGNWQKRRTFYENRVYNYLKKRYAPLILKLSREYDESMQKPVDKKLIWVMWWQGEENMPEVVKICYKRLLKVSAGCEVNLITQDNFADFVTLPEHILQKLNDKKMTLTHFSDILRVNLLTKYGGAWIDATVYAEYLPESMFSDEFYTLHAPGLFPEFFSRGEWVPYLLASDKKGFLMFKAMCEVFGEYWSTHNSLIDYLFVDFLIALIKNEVSCVADKFKNLKENREYYSLIMMINTPYSKESTERLLLRSPLQKLTYKQELNKHTDVSVLTNFGWISERD